HKQTEVQRYSSSNIGDTAKSISSVVTDTASGVVDIFHGVDKAVADTWYNFWKNGKADGIFFFLAEDGIRDLYVTGVQTCALPIYTTSYTSSDVWGSTKAFYEDFRAREKADPDYVHASSAAALVVAQKAIEAAGSLEPQA